MKYRDKLPGLLLGTLLLVVGGQAQALSTDKEQPIDIEADAVDIDEGSETAIYTGNVQLDQGSMRLQADKVVVHQYRSEAAHVVATGKIVRFRQLPDDSKQYVKGRSLRAEYSLDSEIVLLIDEAVLTRGQDVFKSDRIVYDRVKALVKAGASAQGSDRVHTTIGPNRDK